MVNNQIVQAISSIMHQYMFVFDHISLILQLYTGIILCSYQYLYIFFPGISYPHNNFFYITYHLQQNGEITNIALSWEVEIIHNLKLNFKNICDHAL